MNVLEVRDLKKYYISKNWLKPKSPAKITKAIDSISFKIKKGEIVGLLGPNGAGKTTTAQMLLGTLTPTSGEIKYFNQKFSSKSKDLLAEVNFSSAYIDLPWRMTVWENLSIYAHLYGVKNRKQRILKLLDEFEIENQVNKKMDQLSAGQKTRVLLTKAFINYPKVLILDEPTASLDPDIAVKVRRFLIKQQKEYQVAMLFTSHNMHEVQEICDKIIVLKKGKIIAQDTPMQLVKKLKKAKIRMIIIKSKEKLINYLNKKQIKHSWKKQKITFSLNENDIPKVLYQISDQGIRYAEIEILRPNLEDYFLNIMRNK
jgi:ABC-2 type transport system ATP-binding protein